MQQVTFTSPPPRIAKPSRARTRVAIVGGGLSGLTAAWELTRTASLRARYEVTVYQMGWRLGGKLASGRNRAAAMRNEEHGLHVWFGFYDNAFRLAREVYDAWRAPDDCPLRSVDDVFSPHVFTPIGRATGQGWDVWNVQFGRNAATVGRDPTEDDGVVVLTRVLAILRSCLRNFTRGGSIPGPVTLAGRDVPWREGGPRWPWVRRTLDAIGRRITRVLDEVRGQPTHARVVAMRRIVRSIQRRLPWLDALAARWPDLSDARHAVDFFAAFVSGLTDPRYRVLVDFDLDRLNHLEFREWLARHGARREMLDHWPLVRVPYDATFQYEDGDLDRPSFEAGTAARFFLRSFFGYRGAAAYLVEAGMGEAFISPLYEVLRDRGVNFEFFHRLAAVEVDAASQRARALRFRRQARTRGTYEPLQTHRGLRCWSTEPDWSQLVDGEALRAAGAQFEHDPDLGVPRTLRDGDDFDEVVLALPIGALRAWGDRPSCIEGVLRHRPALRRAAQGLAVAPSIAAQLWCDPSTAQLGWDGPRPAMVSWAPPLSIWADMSPVVALEGWPTSRPRSTHYLCGAWVCPEARGDWWPGRSEAAAARAREALARQLQTHGPRLWPGARCADGSFDWNVLHDPLGRSGPDRLLAQYVRGNVEPSDLCDIAATGTAALRPEAHESGLHNVVLAGTWTRTNINSTCVEAATISGLAAARVLTGPGRTILSEFFGQRTRPVIWRAPVEAPSEEPMRWMVG